MIWISNNFKEFITEKLNSDIFIYSYDCDYRIKSAWSIYRATILSTQFIACPSRHILSQRQFIVKFVNMFNTGLAENKLLLFSIQPNLIDIWALIHGQQQVNGSLLKFIPYTVFNKTTTVYTLLTRVKKYIATWSYYAMLLGFGDCVYVWRQENKFLVMFV